ncbi:helix-turn-helix domain-containing protein [Streptosporangium sp. NPDC051023]|uniref:helix-turn-helix domain-containing protein n=1 Tax=Streptosporangium sp. NPDC051023 TaxID=3155410 RepID=UPI003450A344
MSGERERWAGHKAGVLAELCSQTIARRVSLSTRAAEEIVASTPHYRQHGPTVADLVATVWEFMVGWLTATESGGPAGPGELAAARRHGARRAAQGIAVEDVITGFYVGYRTLWRDMADRAAEQGVSEILLEASEASLGWMLEITTAISAGHHDAVAGRRVLTAAARQRLVNLASVPGATGDAEELRLAAEQAGLDPGAGLQCWWAPIGAATGEVQARIQAGLGLLPGAFAVGQVTTALLVLGHGADEEAVAAVLGEADLTSVAVGLRRTGPYAARESLTDARAAAALAAGRAGLWRFAVLWPLVITASAGERLEPLLAPAVTIAREYPHLAEAVGAFADRGLSVSAAARRLNVHPNTLSYRLERWQDLTGTDVRTVSGLTISRTAVEIAAGSPAPNS